MTGRIAWALPLIAGLAAWAFPAEAEKKRADYPGAQVCELEWNASFGTVSLVQRISGSGVIISDNLSISRAIPGGSGLESSLNLSESGSQRIFTLWLGGPSRKGRNQRLVFAVPGSEPLVVAADEGAYRVKLDQAQLAYLLRAAGKMTYRLVKHDSKGREKEQLAEGQLDLSQLAGQELAGLPEAAHQARAVLARARTLEDSPCAMAWAADMNASYSSEPARKWLTLDCGEEWSSPLGGFGLQPGGFFWQPRLREGVLIKFSASLPIGSRADQQGFIDNRNAASRYGSISVNFPGKAWQMNFQGSDQTAWKRQAGELSRGSARISNVLTPSGGLGFQWSEFARLLGDQGDLTISARDTPSGLRFDTVLPWSEIAAAEAELRAGHARMRERERDPLARCKAQVQEEGGMEEEIVT